MVRRYREERFAVILSSFKIVTHSEDTFLFELGHDRLSNELIEVVIIYFRALSFSHAAVVEGESKLPLSVLPHDVRMLQQIGLWQPVEILFFHTGVRRDPVFLSKDTVDHFRIGVRKIEYSCRLVAGQAELGDQNEYLQPHCIRDIDLSFARFPYLLRSYWHCQCG